ncbi:MAG: response regulator [Chloroflexi bacterium]|nr:response regulator [Chloroflexota bacterium]
MPKILIVDDDRSMVKLLTTLLQLDGFQVIHEARGAEVLGIIRAQRPDAVLMDVHLSDADGIDLLRQVRADAAIGGTPIIIASGEDVRYQCEEAGANGFILKPYSPDQLTEALKKAIV